MGKLYSVLNDSKYPSVEDLLFAITDKLYEDLGIISDNANSGEYSLDEIAKQINKVMEMIKRPAQEYMEVTLMTFETGDKVYSKSMKQNLVIGRKEEDDSSICIDVSSGMPEARKFGTYIVLNEDLESGWKTPEELKLLRRIFLTDAEKRRLEYLSKQQ